MWPQPFLPAEGPEAEFWAGLCLSSHTAFWDRCSSSCSVHTGPPLGDRSLEETWMALGDSNTSCFPRGPRFRLGGLGWHWHMWRLPESPHCFGARARCLERGGWPGLCPRVGAGRALCAQSLPGQPWSYPELLSFLHLEWGGLGRASSPLSAGWGVGRGAGREPVAAVAAGVGVCGVSPVNRRCRMPSAAAGSLGQG